ncbi:hypothetical protein Y032_0501g2589 [Ancylostoma ceylanicum]|nr:hypothetical protein Y032_0501g2589 [Ancylostoma ceylanicum]
MFVGYSRQQSASQFNSTSSCKRLGELCRIFVLFSIFEPTPSGRIDVALSLPQEKRSDQRKEFTLSQS